ncbi:ABC transporter permease [Anaeromicropila herbilytica]|uniref:ABC transporter permease n=1 Tax=Anaeromicropila herbilytica TaxID=2785025 RepID=A0A7R7IG46_9FIRM|nr:ABC transporter permease [Anaeromicropila herbilytica]BCN32708.1 ABC transporter permease [Anaeromicropila herbilytica]
MMNVITSECYKIFRSKILYVISIILLSINVIQMIALIYVKKTSTVTAKLLEEMSGINGYQGSYNADIVFYIIVIFAACLITAEYANGSIRQMACHGIARWKLVLGQYIAISSVVTVILITYGLINLLSSTILCQLGDIDMNAFIRMNLGMICMFWGVSGIGTFFSYLFKNSGITIAISVLLILCGNIIAQAATLITKNDIFLTYSLSNMRKTIIDLNAKPEDVITCSMVFLIIGIATMIGSTLLFAVRDVD